MSIIQGNAHTSAGGYQIERSLRFNSADSAYLNRTPGSASNRRTWTISCWVKRSSLGVTRVIAEGGSPDGATTRLMVRFLSTDALSVATGTGNLFVSSAVYRDLSAWYHIVVAFDTPNATASNRYKVYVNGSQITGTDNYPSQNDDTGWNMAQTHSIGRSHIDAGSYFNGYITEFYAIDGQALTPSSFGETDAQTGVWKPKAYSGTYGTNGFFLKFADNSNTTAATLGKDSSGNGNNWTPNNFSVTAGAGNDSMVDSPTAYGTDTGVGGSVRGNYATFNPLAKGSTVTIANGNLDVANTTSGGAGKILGTIGVTSGKWYAEATMSGGGGMPGIAEVTASLSGYPGAEANSWGYNNGGQKYNNGAGTNYGASFTTNDVIGIALDMDGGSVTFYKNGTSQGVAYSSGISGKTITFAGRGDTSTTESWNFGQRAFAYTAPSGFKALCTQNLTTPAIGATSTTQAGKYFNAVARNGYGTGGGTITTGFYPDFIWEKQRNGASDHYLVNTIAGGTKTLSSNKTAAEATDSNWISAFSSTGYTHGSSDFGTGDTVAVWAWNANSGSSSSNTSGTITSTVSANTTAGFSIVTFTTDGTTKTVGHGLGAKPSVVIVKSRNSAGDWLVITDITGSMQYGVLNSTSAFASIGYSAPTSTVFSYNDNNGNTQVAYCFAPVAGYSAFGSYTGNGSTDGPFVYLGFRPRYVLIRKTNSTGNWQIQDTTRTPFNWTCAALFPDSSAAEITTEAEATYGRDYLSNGMKIRASHTSHNNSGDTYMYMAFAESPFKYALAR